MKINSLLIFILSAFLFAACHHSHSNHQGKLELNQGEKWKVNEEMTPHIQKGKLILEEYMQDENASDYKQLAKDIEEQNNQLIKSCTMKGAAHDALHQWLVPHLDLVKDLKKASNEEDAKKIIGQLEASYQNYEKYFQ